MASTPVYFFGTHTTGGGRRGSLCSVLNQLANHFLVVSKNHRKIRPRGRCGTVTPWHMFRLMTCVHMDDGCDDGGEFASCDENGTFVNTPQDFSSNFNKQRHSRPRGCRKRGCCRGRIIMANSCNFASSNEMPLRRSARHRTRIVHGNPSFIHKSFRR
jgi:hypothetical protein